MIPRRPGAWRKRAWPFPRNCGTPLGIGQALILQTVVLMRLEAYEPSRAALEKALTLIREYRINMLIPGWLPAAAALAFGLGESHIATRLFGAAESTRQHKMSRRPLRRARRGHYEPYKAISQNRAGHKSLRGRQERRPGYVGRRGPRVRGGDPVAECLMPCRGSASRAR